MSQPFAHPLWLRAACLSALACLGPPLAAPAQQQDGAFGEVIRIELDAFRAEAGTITFSELPVGTHSPVFYPSNYGAPETGVLVGFSGFFEDQRRGTAAECPPNTKVSGCVSGMPFAPLRLASNAPDTVIAWDGPTHTRPRCRAAPDSTARCPLSLTRMWPGLVWLAAFSMAGKLPPSPAMIVRAN